MKICACRQQQDHQRLEAAHPHAPVPERAATRQAGWPRLQQAAAQAAAAAGAPKVLPQL